MKKNQIIRRNLEKWLRINFGMKTPESRQLIDAFFGQIVLQLSEGGSAIVRDFGSFSVVKKKRRMTKHPRTGEEFEIPEHMAVKFKPAAKLVELVARLPVTS